MYVLLRWVARVAGIFGVAAITSAVIGRLAGTFWLGPFQVGTILQAGMAATLVACLAYLAALIETVSSK